MDDQSDLIVADGQSDVSETKRGTPNGRGLWVLLGLAIGLGVAGLLASSAGPTVGPDTTPGTTTTTTIDESSPTVGVGEVIPGFPDGMNVLVSPGGGRAFEVVTWPVSGPAIRRSVPLGDRTTLGSARFDVSGHYLAALVDDGNGGEALMTGQINSLLALDGDVSGFAWHDSRPSTIAWTTAVEGSPVLMRSDDSATAETVATLDFEGVLTAYGDWGYAVEGAEMLLAEDRSESVTQILGPEGESLLTIDGRVIGTHSRGILAVSDGEGVSVISLDATPLQGEIEHQVDGLDVVFSPDGWRIAVSGFQGMEVIDLATGDLVDTYPVRFGNGPTRWSSDGRFLIVTGFRGIIVIDTESGEIYNVLGNDGTRAAAPTPIGSDG